MKHLALFLYAGDYRDASLRREAGLPDRYRHHTYALESLTALRAMGVKITVIQMRSSEPYDEEATRGIRFIGLGQLDGTEAADWVRDYLRVQGVTHAMVRFPSAEILREVVSSTARGSVVFADSFPTMRFRHRLGSRRRYQELGELLRGPGLDFVANHQVNSSRELVDVFGVDPARVVPWDWPLDLLDLAADTSVRSPDGDVIRLGYVGMIGRSKGVWDLLRAASILRKEGYNVVVEMAGAGEVDRMWSLADRLGLRDHLTFHGRIGGAQIIELMQRSSFVCVPSQQTYPEGLPLTIYEAMACGTPLLASNHRMFDGVVRHGETGFVFPARRPRRMAATVIAAWEDSDQYRHVSKTATEAYATMGHPTLWGDLLKRWVRGTESDLAWVRSQALGANYPAVAHGFGGRFAAYSIWRRDRSRRRARRAAD